MQESHYRFTNELERIADFLYAPESINHDDVDYMNFTSGTGVFQDRKGGSSIYVCFRDGDSTGIEEIQYSLVGEDGIIHRWVAMFRQEYSASVEKVGEAGARQATTRSESESEGNDRANR